jgi:Tol biopolymer transport system component
MPFAALDPGVQARRGLLAEMTWVSLAPGSFPEGESATIRNRRTGGMVATRLIGGGFDPVPIGGSAGDTLETVVAGGEAPPVVLLSEVPRRRPPTIVRTVPPRGKKDVPLNTRIAVIFSEPVDSRTVTTESIQLRAGNAIVNGGVELDGHGIAVIFSPSQPLAALTPYTLAVSTGVRDLDGDSLAEPARIEFTTSEAPPEPGVIAYAAEIDGNADIYLPRVGGLPPLRLTFHAAVDRDPAWSPDGQRIAFTSERDGNAEIYVMAADGGNVTRLTNDAAADHRPSWSPDGSSIAFVSERDGNAEIYVMAADGSNETRLTQDPGHDGGPDWSPSGDRIAFASDRDGAPHIYLMNTDGSNVVQLTTGVDEEQEPAWSPDGTRLAFARLVRSTPCVPFEQIDTGSDPYGYEVMCRRDIVVVGSDGSGPVRLDLPTTPGTSPTGWWQSVFLASDPSWSPDGRDIAAAVFYCLSDFGGGDCHSENAIVTLSASGAGELLELARGSVSAQQPVILSNPAWRP